MLSGLLITLNILVCIALVGVVLMQRSEGGAFGSSGNPTGLITARGAGDLLTRTTWILFGIFMALSLALTLLGAHDRATSSVIEKLKLQQANPNALIQKAPAPGAPTTPQGQAPSPFTSAPIASPPAPSAFAPPTPSPQPSAPRANPSTGRERAAAPAHAPSRATEAPTTAAPSAPVLIAPPPQPAPTVVPQPQPAPAEKSDQNAPATTGQP